MSNLDAYYDPPEEPTSRCVCGHDFDQHDKDMPLGDPQAMLNDLRKIAELRKPRGAQGHVFDDGTIDVILSKALAICNMAGCECREFEEADPSDDGDYAFDSRRDKSLGG